MLPAESFGELCRTPVVVAVFDGYGHCLAALWSYLCNRFALSPVQRREETLFEVHTIQARERPTAPGKHGCFRGVFSNGSICFLNIEVTVALGIHIQNECCRMMTDHSRLLARPGR